MVYKHNGILFSQKKEGNSDTCYNMDEPWGHYAEWNEPVTEVQIRMSPLIQDTKSSRIQKNWKENGSYQGQGRRREGGIAV